jgi:hypothetical protein
VTAGGINPDNEKIKAVVEFPTPQVQKSWIEFSYMLHTFKQITIQNRARYPSISLAYCISFSYRPTGRLQSHLTEMITNNVMKSHVLQVAENFWTRRACMLGSETLGSLRLLSHFFSTYVRTHNPFAMGMKTRHQQWVTYSYVIVKQLLNFIFNILPVLMRL